MKNGVFKRVVSTALAAFLAITSGPIVAKEMNADAAKVLETSPGHTQETGTYNGYHHEIWQADTPNKSTMTLYDDGGGFSTQWQCGPANSRGNFLARRGLYYGRNTGKHWQDRGNFTCDFACDWSAGSSGNSRICIYGWTENPLVEFYIIEDWKNWVPSSANAKQVTIDGSVYDVFTNPMNSYNITGSNGPFTQYISVRKSRRTSGTISIYKHFEAWESLGMKMGDLYEVAFNVEGWESDGKADVKKMVMSTNGKDEDPTSTTVSTTTTQGKAPDPDTNGDYITNNFESGKGDWAGRGDASVSTDNKSYYDGSSSLKVTGRTDNWHGAEIDLSGTTFVPGNTYSFSTAVLQNSGSATSMKLTLQYSDGGTENYDEVAMVTAKNGEWTKLENKEYTIPAGASSMKLYVEAPDSLTDFNIDAVQLSKSGKASSVVNGGGTVDGSGSTVTVVTTSNVQTTGGGGVVTTPNVNTNDPQLKYVFSKYFKFGTAVSANEVNQHGDFVKKHFNSITPENELKPDAILDQTASKAAGNLNPQVKLGYGAKQILDFAAKNNIPVRGHTLIWHSQTPSWFFKENFDDNGAAVSKDVMNQRIDNFIKNVFDMLKKEYPTVNFYAYDIANECFDDQNNGLRAAGWNQQGGQSPWNLIYGDDSYLEVAFTSAKKYAPAGCKLFYNDYNEYYSPKHDNIVNLCKKLYSKGILDGVGMQSHLGTSQPDINTYKKALADFEAIGCEIQVTELDITKDNGASDDAQAAVYKNVVEAIKNTKNVTSLTVWGTNDNMSWRRSQAPLLFDGSYNAKPAFTAIVGLVPTSEWGVTSGETVTTTTTTTTTTTSTTTTSTTTTVSENTVTTTTTTQPSSTTGATLPGDANNDGDVNMADAVFVMQCIANPDKYRMNDVQKANADVDGSGDVTNMDALQIQRYKLGLVQSLGSGEAQKKTNVTTTTTVPFTTTTSIATFTTTTTTTTAQTTTATTTTEAKADFFTDNFNNSVGNWESRGNASIAVDKDNYYDGGSSLKVSGRTSEWNGAAISLNSSFKAGSTYSFSAAVLQKVSASDDFKLSLEYTDASGEKAYDTIAEAKADKNTWTKLENAAYTIPANAKDLLLYVETAASTINFFVDEVAVAASGTKSDIINGKGVVSEEPESKVDTSKKLVAISFDDGAVGNSPTDSSMRIINAIASEGWHATFFYVGNWINTAGKEEEVRYAYSKGMEIANHTTSHPDLTQKSSSEIRSEFDQTHAKLKSIIGAEPSKVMRLPYLSVNQTVQSTLNDVALISCSVDSGDWNNGNKNSCVNAIKTAAQQGRLDNAIVLFHETYGFTADAIEELVPWLKQNGYQIVTVSELFAARGKELKGGQVYKNA